MTKNLINHMRIMRGKEALKLQDTGLGEILFNRDDLSPNAELEQLHKQFYQFSNDFMHKIWQGGGEKAWIAAVNDMAEIMDIMKTLVLERFCLHNKTNLDLSQTLNDVFTFKHDICGTYDDFCIVGVYEHADEKKLGEFLDANNPTIIKKELQ